jgi:hypothetical protein
MALCDWCLTFQGQHSGLETLGTNHSVTWHYNPEETVSQLHRCKSQKFKTTQSQGFQSDKYVKNTLVQTSQQ